MVRFATVGALVALAGMTLAGMAHAKPLIVLFTPDITSDIGDMRARENTRVARTQDAALSMREQFTDSGLVDVVLYAPDNALFERAMLEAKIKPADPKMPTASERYAIAKAVGASYGAYVITYDPIVQTEGAVEVELQTEQVEGRKTWKQRRNLGGGGGVVASPQGTPRFSNALVSATNTLVQDFLNGPMHDLSQTTAPSLPPPQPIPVIKETPSNDGKTMPDGAPSLSNSVPTNTLPANTEPNKTTPSRSAEPLTSSGANTDSMAEAEKRRGDEQMRAADTSGAILSYRKAVRLAPQNAEYRSVLIQAYMEAGQKGDALSEAKRTLGVLRADDQKNRAAISRLLAEILTQNGDATAARTTYEDIIRTQSTATWARVELAELLASQGQTAEAEDQLKTAIKLSPDDKEAHLGYAKLLVTKGNYDAALIELTAGAGSDNQEARYNAAVSMFDQGVQQIVERVEQNRTAWENKQIAQEVFYKATSAQSSKVSGLVALLKAVPPPSGEEALKQKRNKRILAASLLLQGVASLLTQVETGDADAGNQATVYLSQFKHTMRDLTGTGRNTTP